MDTKTQKRINRHHKIRTRMSGTSERPRLAVFRSNRFISAQIIDDAKGVTLVAATDMKKGKQTVRGVQAAKTVGTKIAELAKTKKITNVVFDRAGFIYTGRVKALADAAREGGLIF